MFNFLKQFNKGQLTQFARFQMSTGGAKGKGGAKPAGEKPAAEKPAGDKKGGDKPKKK